MLRAGDMLTLDGSSGQVIQGALPMVQGQLAGDFATLMQWSDAERRMKVRTNADLPKDAIVARQFGADGIGLCRTEHMFSEGVRANMMREMIIADTQEEPEMGIEQSRLEMKAEQLREINPMLGNRGARLAICYPEIAEMQTRAIFEAAIVAGKKTGEPVVPEVVCQRAAIRADYIAQSADFFSFGTNDLTQTTLGISRDDSSTFLNTYLSKGVIDLDPFINLDIEGVGELMRLATQKGRGTKSDIILGITGEHGGDPTSIAFCEDLGLDYVSCSPYRVPIARLAAAQSAIISRDESGQIIQVEIGFSKVFYMRHSR
ncbi:Pyruvate, phosphate dikinase [Nymphon striatum]|nr:Pyruvate, phosphate dikinase [Nymphon striatum]